MNTKPQIVEIDLRFVASVEELHIVFERVFGFSAFYGRNWDAFWDVITGLVELPAYVRLVGWEDFRSRFPQDAQIMRECFEVYRKFWKEKASEIEYGPADRPSRYLLLKCVTSGEPMYAPPSRTLRLAELQRLVEADPELRWGLNSDRSVAMPPHAGFLLQSDAERFFVCYEFNEGVAIHAEREPRVLRKAAGFAEHLGAELFEF